MKICIPATGKGNLDDPIEKNIENARVLTIIDTETDQVTVISISDEQISESSSMADFLSKKRIDVMVCTDISNPDLVEFSKKKIIVAIDAHGSVKNSYNMWKNGELTLVHAVETY